MDEFDVKKIRRFTLISSILLLFYIGTEMHLKEDQLSILNNSFYFDKHWLIPLILMSLTLYSMLRFFYYGITVNPHPIRARKILIQHKIPIDGWDDITGSVNAKNEFDIKRKQLIIQQVAKYFPGIKYDDGKKWIESISYSTKIKYHIHDLDYYAPLWLGSLSIFFYLYKLIF